VDGDGHEQLNRTAAIPTEEEIVEERPSQPMQQQQ
jgi:hypothetical protein